MASLAMLAYRFGDAARARRLHALLEPFAAHAVITFIQPVVCLGSVARYLALLAATMGDAERAGRLFEDAIAANARMGARPYLARCQVEYARFLLGRSEKGDLERAAELIAEARATAGSIGQNALREELSALSTSAAEVRASPVSDARAPDTATLRRDGDLWTVAYREHTFHLKDSKGLQLVSTLLRHPGRELHVLDLVGTHEALPGADAGSTQGLVVGDLGDAGEILDPAARAAYKRRLEDLRDELEEAEGFNDTGRAERARQEIDFLSTEIARGIGLGGRARRGEPWPRPAPRGHHQHRPLLLLRSEPRSRHPLAPLRRRVVMRAEARKYATLCSRASRANSGMSR
jgi:hypothetical protein